MSSLPRRLYGFLTRMDARRWRTALAVVVLFVCMAAVFAAFRSHIAGDAEVRLEQWLAGHGAGVWGMLATIVLFTACAFIGLPQFMLIAVSVVVFGPWHGFAYSWLATVASAAATYWVGRGPTARAVDIIVGPSSEQLSALVARNAFWGSLLIRNVPSAPFIVVNAAFGALRANFWAYLAGCAVGVLPKTAMVAFFGGSFVTATRGDGVWTSLILIAVALVALGIMLAAREWVRRYLS